MIVEACIAGVVVIFVSSLTFANKIHKRILEDERHDPEKKKASYAERRRILQTQRDAYWNGYNKHSLIEQTGVWQAIKELDSKLLALAEEEGKS